MDPKQNPTAPGQLDPKLQEAYDKVMAVPTTPSVTSPIPSPDAAAMPTPTPAMDTPAPITPTDPAALPATPAPVMPAEPTMPMPSPADGAQSSTTVTLNNPGMAPAKMKKPMKVSPVVIILGGLVLLIAYALIWIKIFNLQIPFVNH